MEGRGRDKGYDLHHLEHGTSTASAFKLPLLIFRGKSNSQVQKSEVQCDEKPVTAPAPEREVVGKVKEFFGGFSEAIKRLQEKAKDSMQVVTELHTPEAVAAGKSTIVGYQPHTDLTDGSDEESCSDDESLDSSGEDDSSDDGTEESSDGESGSDDESEDCSDEDSDEDP